MKVFDLEDNGNTSGESYASWTSAVVEWKDARDHFINEYPDFHKRYVDNRGKPTETKASAEVNGGEYSS